ncbi:MAG TPA: hypothetical protein VE200_05460, partial [Xanthobacteraceae bacterium]|nr:hypothetical protein [Xanthobacteraceae bacterium]
MPALVASLALPAASLAHQGGASLPTKASALSASVRHERTFELPRRVTHFAVHWRGHATASVEAAFSRDGTDFSPWRRVRLDELG